MSSSYSQSKSESLTRVEELWKRAKPPVEKTADHKLPFSQTAVSRLLSGERSWVWTSLSQMSALDQSVMMSNIVRMWPYPWERRALNWPLHIGLFTNCLTSTIIATKINSDMLAYNPKMSVLESIRKCPKIPFVFAVYSSGIAFYAMKQTLVTPYIYNENEPCRSCILCRNVLLSWTSGILMPLLTTPYICYYIMLQGKSDKFPLVTSYIDFLTLSWEGSRSARSVLVKLIPLQAAVAAISAYSILWGRERVFDTLDADPDFTREFLISLQLKSSFTERVIDFLRTVPYCRDIIGKRPPETERLAIK